MSTNVVKISLFIRPDGGITQFSQALGTSGNVLPGIWEEFDRREGVSAPLKTLAMLAAFDREEQAQEARKAMEDPTAQVGQYSHKGGE
jgi:hypothetical protein